jgi:hypothetical protein
MYKDFVLIPDDQPGVLARIGEALGEAGINIDGLSAFTGEGKGVVHLLVNEPERAQQVLAEIGFEVRAARDVVIVDVEDRPGSMGAVCRHLADGGVNIEQAYLAAGKTRLVLAVDDIGKAREVIENVTEG